MNIKNRKFIINVLKIWFPLALTITLICGLIYTVVQQDIRIGANDPQIQLAEDISAQLLAGQQPQYFVPPVKIDISKSLATFIMIFDKNGKLIASSASLDGNDPTLPQGVLNRAKSEGELRFTWQPKSGVRSAVVIDYYKGLNPGFVLIGRSIREIEIRESQQEMIIFLGWFITIALSFASVVILEKIKW